jgi:ABC-type multidrug transport system fused ATPase/permease subunit
VVIIAIFWVIIYFNKHTTFYRKQRKENNVRTTGALAKIIMSKFEILQSNSINKEIDKIDDISDYSWELARKQNFWQSYLFQGPKFLLSCIIVSCYYYLGMRVFWGTYLLSEMVGILTVLALFEVTLRDSIEFYENYTKAAVHIEKLWDFLDNTPEIQGYDFGEKYIYKNGNFEFKKINFSYNANTEVLKNFSLKIQWGKKTALVGRSWGGKTTMMKLLAGYMRPTWGKLLVDEQNISDMRLDSYYPHIGYLTQEPSVFDGTIEENLLYGAKKKPTLKDISQAIELSECQFIYELENWIKTEIWERWVRLSGGQKQRLAIAKIFLKDPEIILLDEPTAALDSYSEQKVAKAFEHLFRWRTVIVIAHRLQTVKSADDIIVLEKWKIVERGTHKELLKLGKKYAGMVDLQSGIVREEEENDELRIKN